MADPPGPAADPELLILISLADGPKHGYAIMTDVEAATSTRLGPGTLYTAISRLAEKRLIAADGAAGRQRPYRITPAGAEAARAYLRHVQQVAAVGLKRLEAYA